MRAVVDTNIVVSRFLTPTGVPARIVAAWEAGRFEVVITEAILAEYQRVLAYDRLQRRHGLTQEEIARGIDALRKHAILAEPREVIAIIADDPSDNIFLEAAVAGNCDFIVSGDAHLLRLGEYRGIEILTPAVFLLMLG